MEKVLIILQVPKKSELYPTKLPPLGILSIAAYVEHKGINIDVMDCQVQQPPKDYSVYSTILFGVNGGNIENTIQTIKNVKIQNPSAKILLGGPIGLNQGAYLLGFPEIDAVIIGEGENTVHEYLIKKNIAQIRGLLYIGEDKEAVYSGDRSLIQNLDTLPFPALNKVPLEKYYVAIEKETPVSHIITSRGCLHGCIFCSHQQSWRPRSAENVVSEIEWQVQKLGIREIIISDDDFGRDKKRVMDICNGIIKKRLSIKWQLRSGIRVDEIDKSMLMKMKQAGLWLVCIAPETGNKESIKRIGKGFDLQQVRQVVKWCKELELNTYAFFIMGFPWETRRHLEDTLCFSKELDTDFVQFSRVVSYEGTPLYDNMGVRPRGEYKEIGQLYGTVSHNNLALSKMEILAFIKRGYRNHYLNPQKLPELLGLFL